jgi:hypothetical protein
MRDVTVEQVAEFLHFLAHLRIYRSRIQDEGRQILEFSVQWPWKELLKTRLTFRAW